MKRTRLRIKLTQVQPKAAISYLASHLHPVKNGSKLLSVPKYDARTPKHRHQTTEAQ